MRTPRRTVLGRLLSSANVLATVAVVVALASTGTVAALAAKPKPKPKPPKKKSQLLITGAHVKNESLMGRDIKNGELSAIEFSSTTRKTLAVRGDAGDRGPAGPEGSQGSIGKKGDAGVPAPRAFTFQYLARSNHVGGARANPQGSELASMTCDDYPDLVGCPGGPIRFPTWNYNCPWLGDGGIPRRCNTTTTSVPQLTRTFQTVLVTADNPNGGLLDVPFPATVAMHASATFYTQRPAVRQRLDCQLQIARVQNGITLPAQSVGLPITTYRHIDTTLRTKMDRLLNIAVTGAIVVTPGRFETFLACRAPDDDGEQFSRLEFIEGNVIVHSTRTNGEA